MKMILFLLVFANVSYGSVTYDLTGGNLTYGGPWASSSPNVEATLSVISENSQTLTAKQDILNFFNSSSFSFKASTSNGLLTEMNNGNAEWVFFEAGNNLGTTLIVAPEKITLLYDTDEGSEIRLILRGISENIGMFQISQSYNAIPSNFINFQRGAVNTAEEYRSYDSPFVFNAVPEPSSLSLLLAGGAVFAAARRRKVD